MVQFSKVWYNLLECFIKKMFSKLANYKPFYALMSQTKS